MGLKHLIILVLAAVILTAVILWIVPQTNSVINDILRALKLIVLDTFIGMLILTFGGLLGFFFKGYFVARCDKKFEPEVPISTAYHVVIAFSFAVLAGMFQLALMYPVMGWDTWIRSVAIEIINWSGIYENPPVVWFFVASVEFFVTYLLTSYMIDQPNNLGRYRRY